MLKVGTFSICGSMTKGYYVVDRDMFNNWGRMPQESEMRFKTRQEATEHARNCHDFKTGKRTNPYF